MTLMQPIIRETIPAGEDWVYEVKYDGFRCILTWTDDSVQLTSRNGGNLSAQFPEIIDACRSQQPQVASYLPLELDGELVVLNDTYQANFAMIQKRSRLQNAEKINEQASERPASFMAFDLLSSAGESHQNQPLNQRKSELAMVFGNTKQLGERLQYVACTEDAQALWQALVASKGEGLVAKQRDSLYQPGKKHHGWFKIKNWRTISAFLTHFNPENDYFTAAVYKDKEIAELGKVKHGLDEETWKTLKDIFLTKGKQVDGGFELPPAVCAEINTLDLLSGELREPHFHRLTPEKSASSCTWHQAQLDLAMFPEAVDVTHTTKDFWPRLRLTKGDLLVYIRNIAPYMLPFLRERLLTIIRCPDGVQGESFFQKHRPDDAPDFLKGITHDGDRRFICNNPDALIWLTNQGTLEYHIPFQTADQDKPREIVFDLDPPGREQFNLAIQAARLLKQVLDDLQLVSFLKTSGGKGLQVHIPLPPNSLTYEETGVLTQAVAWTLENSYPDLFTTERMKAKRGGRLYIDYLQHAEGKTIVTPYSPRKRDDATVATPLFWEELTDNLRPDEFRIDNVFERVQTIGCPFAGYFAAGDAQMLTNVLRLIRK